HHFDFYRLNSEDEAEELGLEELFGASNAVCAVEWASKIPSYLPESYATVTIEKLGENRRKITIRTPFEVKL
ncbi:MAG: tRNA (adenosine(37)-N6)-threonylcarbamoyltransferase complex ATPase subunit type 1 TsaE, partial [Clostridia bacterium]|nr:tRNA (adenosine(37)-N6)-threonylcarbamoyltransferase complex ATPase subunit type 1 TsaE [Clostridia bacterium]